MSVSQSLKYHLSLEPCNHLFERHNGAFQDASEGVSVERFCVPDETLRVLSTLCGYHSAVPILDFVKQVLRQAQAWRKTRERHFAECADSPLLDFRVERNELATCLAGLESDGIIAMIDNSTPQIEDMTVSTQFRLLITPLRARTLTLERLFRPDRTPSQQQQQHTSSFESTLTTTKLKRPKIKPEPVVDVTAPSITERAATGLEQYSDDDDESLPPPPPPPPPPPELEEEDQRVEEIRRRRKEERRRKREQIRRERKKKKKRKRRLKDVSSSSSSSSLTGHKRKRKRRNGSVEMEEGEEEEEIEEGSLRRKRRRICARREGDEIGVSSTD